MSIQTVILVVAFVVFGIVLGIQAYRNFNSPAPKSFDDLLKDVVWAFVGVSGAMLIVYAVVAASMGHFNPPTITAQQEKPPLQANVGN